MDVYTSKGQSIETPYRQQITFKDLFVGFHEGVLAKILLDATQHDDLLRFLSTCAQVNRAWRSIVGGSAAYGLCLARTQVPRRDGMSGYEADEDERARVFLSQARRLIQQLRFGARRRRGRFAKIRKKAFGGSERFAVCAAKKRRHR